MPLPTDSDTRKRIPVASGVLDYFPNAIAAVAECSYLGNEKHNPGQPLHWSREKSSDHADCIARHLLERGTLDADGIRHSAHLAWRALAMLQLEDERCVAIIGERQNAMSTLIKEIIKVNSEGVAFSLTEKASLNGGIKSLEWFVSWDRIGKALFAEQYSNSNDVRNLRLERGEE